MQVYTILRLDTKAGVMTEAVSKSMEGYLAKCRVQTSTLTAIRMKYVCFSISDVSSISKVVYIFSHPPTRFSKSRTKLVGLPVREHGIVPMVHQLSP